MVGEQDVMWRGESYGEWLPWLLGGAGFVGGALVLAMLLAGWMRHRRLSRGVQLLEAAVKGTGETLSRVQAELEQATDALTAMEVRWTEGEAARAVLRNALGELQGQVTRLEDGLARSRREWAESERRFESALGQWDQERQAMQKSLEEPLRRVEQLEARVSSSEESTRVLVAQVAGEYAGQASRLHEMESRVRDGEARMRDLELRLPVRGNGKRAGDFEQWPPRLERDPDEPADRWPVWKEGELRSPKGF
ncbi:MAG TPA: hypothetical protein VMN36_07620 [Verrucomicrobiales bacterium]|nr:hypothetical protein [Verrucomicrobiales bacterium]